MPRHSSTALLVSWLAVAAPLSSHSGHSPQASESHFEIVPLADGVYAALQPGRLRFYESNSLVIINESDVIVVDAQGSPGQVQSLIREIQKLTDKPVRKVVATHWHTDHTWSYSLYRDAFPGGVDLIGHDSLREDLPKRAAPLLQEEIIRLDKAIPEAKQELESKTTSKGESMTAQELEKLDAEIAWAESRLKELRGIEVVPPTTSFTETLTFSRGERTIRLFHYRGHTGGDVVAYLPRERILATGDLLDDMPSGFQGDIASWIEALDQVETLDFDTLVPGHGRIHHGKDHLRLVRELLESIVAQVASAVEKGQSLKELQRSIELDAFRTPLAGDDPLSNRVFDRFIPETVERAYRQAKGEVEP